MINQISETIIAMAINSVVNMCYSYSKQIKFVLEFAYTLILAIKNV